jgi:hypothetical protein
MDLGKLVAPAADEKSSERTTTRLVMTTDRRERIAISPLGAG